MGSQAPHRRALLSALLVVFALRLVHMRYAVAGPLTWQLGADEDFYFRFAQDVASGSGGFHEVFAFMDPLYGYILGAVLALGAGVFPLYLLQILIDCLSAFGLYRIACTLGRPRAGLIALILYGLTGTAIAYSMALLKATWVAAFVIWWIYWALHLASGYKLRSAMLFGIFCGLGVALRANLVLLVPFAILCIGWLRWKDGARPRELGNFAAMILLGLALPLLLLTARNAAISGKWSPMPNNGGVVLHQIYNAENPDGRAGVPSFVGRYTAPEEIWAGYRREAERRAGHALLPQDVDGYWRGQAVAYLQDNRWQSLTNGVRKLREASAYPEVPNTRNYVDERIVSPVLAALPLPFGWLFALGVPGLFLLAWRDRRAVVVLAPVATGALTLAVFFAEDRFRFNIIGPFVLGAGIWLDMGLRFVRDGRWPALFGAAVISGLFGVWSVTQARLLLPEFPSDAQRLAWGYIKSGQEARATGVLQSLARQDREAPGLHEILGFLAVRETRWVEAVTHLQQAAEQRPDRHETWHNLSIALEHSGSIEHALAAQGQALALRPGDADYLLRAGDLLQALGRAKEASDLWTCASKVRTTERQQHDLNTRRTAHPTARTDNSGHIACPN